MVGHFRPGLFYYAAPGLFCMGCCDQFYAGRYWFCRRVVPDTVDERDVIDYDEKLTGLRREGMYAGINSFVTKPAISLAQAAFITIVGWFGFDQSLAKGLQPESAHTGILMGLDVDSGCALNPFTGEHDLVSIGRCRLG